MSEKDTEKIIEEKIKKLRTEPIEEEINRIDSDDTIIPEDEIVPLEMEEEITEELEEIEIEEPPEEIEDLYSDNVREYAEREEIPLKIKNSIYSLNQNDTGLLSSPPGTGKTHNAIETLLEDGKTFLTLFPIHKNCEEWMKTFSSYPIKVLKGFQYIHFTECSCKLTPEETDVYNLCIKFGIDPIPIMAVVHVDRLENEGKVCSYFEQMKGTDKYKFFFGVHDHLKTGIIKKINPEYAVLDEAFYDKIKVSKEFIMEDLENILKNFTEAIRLKAISINQVNSIALFYKIYKKCIPYFSVIEGLIKTIEEVEKIEPTQTILKGKETDKKYWFPNTFDIKLINNIVDSYRKRWVDISDRHVDLYDENLLTLFFDIFEFIENNKLSPIIYLNFLVKTNNFSLLFKNIDFSDFKIIFNNILSVEDECSKPNVRFVLGNKSKMELEIEYLDFDSLEDLKDRKVMVCDATSNQFFCMEIARKLGMNFKELKINTKPYSYNIIQFMDAYNTLNTLKGMRKVNKTLKYAWKDYLEKIKFIYDIKYNGQRGAIVVKKDFVEKVKVWLIDNNLDLEVYHFRELVGRNALINTKVLFVVGVPELSDEDYWKIAMLWHDKFIKYEHRKNYIKNPYFNSPELNTILFIYREKLLFQIIERLRWYLDSKDKTCYLFTKLEIPSNELKEEDDENFYSPYMPIFTKQTKLKWFIMEYLFSKVLEEKGVVEWEEMKNIIKNDLDKLDMGFDTHKDVVYLKDLREKMKQTGKLTTKEDPHSHKITMVKTQ